MNVVAAQDDVVRLGINGVVASAVVQEGRERAVILPVEVDSDGNELPGDWEYDRKGGYVYCAFA